VTTLFQMQGGKNWFVPKEMNANRFFWDSHWLEIWSNHFYPSMGPNGGSVAMDSGHLRRSMGFSYRKTRPGAAQKLLQAETYTKQTRPECGTKNKHMNTGAPQTLVDRQVQAQLVDRHIQVQHRLL
jgi:hypothetical protein